MRQQQQQSFAAKFVGIDVSMASLAVALAEGVGKAQEIGEVANNDDGWRKLCASLRELRFNGAICMEPTSVYHLGAAAHLSGEGFAVAMVSCKGAKHYGVSNGLRNKTDAADAAVIASYGRDLHQHGKLRLWQAASKAQKKLTSLAKLFFISRNAELGHKRRLKTASKDGKRIIKRWHRQSEQETMKVLGDMIKLCRTHEEFAPMFARLLTIPGVAEQTAAVFVASGAHKCDTAKAASAMHAFVPQQRQSGTSLRSSSLSSCGHRRMRHALYMPAMTAMRNNPLLAALAARLESRGATGKQKICACAHKLFRIMWGVANGDRDFDLRHAAKRNAEYHAACEAGRQTARDIVREDARA